MWSRDSKQLTDSMVTSQKNDSINKVMIGTMDMMSAVGSPKCTCGH